MILQGLTMTLYCTSQVDIPNSVHAYQTAERIREVHPDLDWFHLVGLIHDLGKVMVQFGEPQVGGVYKSTN